MRATCSPSCALVAGPGQADLAQVELDVEVRVVDPVRPSETERHHDQALPQWRGQVQPRLEDLAQPVEGQSSPPGAVGGIEQDQTAHVPDRRRGLHVEELGVQRRQLLHE